jgi:hypothetical protein
MSDNSQWTGMFSVKLVGPSHREFPFFGRAGNPALMNFPDSPQGRRTATEIPIGHRSLVYLMHPVQRFWTAVEYIEWGNSTECVLDAGRRAAAAQGAVSLIEAHSPKFAKLWRCIRILAQIDDPMNAPTPDFGFQEGEVMRVIEQQEYWELFNAVSWTWRVDST